MKLKKKNITVASTLLFILVGVFYAILPEYWQEKIYWKLSAPIRFVQTANLAEVVEQHRLEMQTFYNDECLHGEHAYIAHGGGVGSYTYTNSVEAFADSIAKGFKFIEIDLLETADGHLIGAHSWNDLAKFTGRTAEELQKLPLRELEKLKINGNLKILSGGGILSFLRDNPNIILVTDKIENYELLLKEIPLPERMIVETDWRETPEARYKYQKALQAGVKYPAYSAVWNLDYVEKYEFPIIVVSASQINSSPETPEKLRKLHQKGVTIMVCNSKDNVYFIKEHLGQTVSMIYTDKWYPKGPSPLGTTEH